MAIAYFIPDQAKLLAGQRPSRTATNTSSRAPSNTQASSRLPQSNQAANETAPVNNAANRGYGTTINITVPTLNNTTQEPLGCWDFLTQVFCHALRFYHESSQLQPTVIQISVNFNSQTATTTTNTTTTADNSTATTTNSETLATAAPATTSTEDPKQRKFSKQKN